MIGGEKIKSVTLATYVLLEKVWNIYKEVVQVLHTLYLSLSLSLSWKRNLGLLDVIADCDLLQNCGT